MPTTDRARDLVAAVALIATAIALIATSYSPVTVELPFGGQGAVELSNEVSVAVVPVTIRASDEALWPSDPEILLREASVFFRLDLPGADRDARDAAAVRLTLVPTNLPANGDAAIEAGQVDLGRLCAPERDCELALDLVLEWLEPEASGTLTVGWVADGRILLEGTEKLPIHATARVEAGEAKARAIPILADQVAESGIQLSAERPLAVRRIVVEANSEALPVEVSYPLEGRAFLRVTARPQVTRTLRYAEQAFVATLVPDSETPAWGPTNELDRSLVQFDPFAECASAEHCRRGYTLRLEWISSDPTATVDVSWSMDARLLYHEGPAPNEGAAVNVETDGAWAAEPDAPVLTATHAGRIEVPTDRGGITVRHRITITLNAEAVPATEPIAGGPPAVATITLRAGADRDVTRNGRSPFLVTVGGPPNASQDLRPAVTTDEEVVLTAVPLRGCELGQSCEVDVVIGAGLSAGELRAVAGASLWLDWRVDVRLLYLAEDEVPDGARLEIDDGQLR